MVSRVLSDVLHVVHRLLCIIPYYLQFQLEDSKKPPDVIEKIVTGRMRKFYEETCLTEQPHMVEEGNPKVSKVLDGLGLVVTQFESLTIAA
jgi:translation elongation factor EF-Ts